MVCKTACRKTTLQRAGEVLGTRPSRAYEVIADQIMKMGRLECGQLGRGKRIAGKRNEDIRIALFRPLGSLSSGEEREAVKEMGEPYQLELLAAVLQKEGHQVKIFDQLAGPFEAAKPADYPQTKSNAQMIAEIAAFNPDAVGFTCFTYNFRKGLAIAAELKKKLEVPIMLGGYHATSVGKQHLLFESLAGLNAEATEVFKQDLRSVFQHGIVDYACIGEGVQTVLDIMSVLKGEKKEDDVPGIAFERNGRVYASESERLDLGCYPFPLREAGFDPMTHYATGRGYPFLLLMTSSGCRYSCEYCSTGINYPGLRFRSLENVMQELRETAHRFRPNWPDERIMVNITNEDFAASPARVIAFCNALCNEGLQYVFKFNSFMDTQSILGLRGDEMLSAMARAGFSFCFIGIESMLQSAVEGYARPEAMQNRLQNIQQAIDRMASHNIMYFGDHIAGYPGHTTQEMQADYAELFKLRRMHYAYFPIIAPMPGTPLYWKILWGMLGDGFLEGVNYDQLDANHQVVAIRDGGNVKAIRDANVQRFFTRPEYAIDADEAIRRDPRVREFFGRMLGKVSLDYPENREIIRLAKRYT